nr:MAG: ORF1 [TTV-like mini virus]
MPYYWPRRKRWWWRRRYWPRTRRTRRLVRRNWFRRRRNWVRKTYIHKPLRLRQWNPKIIKTCYIKGQIPLIICGKNRQMFNFIQYKDSIVPTGNPGGGGWSIMVFNLGGLYQEFQKLQNWWTSGNDGLPLCRYLGCDWKFYQSWDTDYIVNYQTNPPMTDTMLKHLNTQPLRALMNTKAIIVENIFRKPDKKRKYIKKHFPPPALLKNQWFFQQDMCNIGLLMLSTSATSLDQFYLPNNELSTNITLLSLNTNIFQNPNFLQEGTQGYQPKSTIYLWGSGNGLLTAPTSAKNLYYLGNLKTYTLGTKITDNTKLTDPTKWGNPFYHDHSHESTKLWYTTTKPTDINTTIHFTELEPIFQECRYNPLKDTGEGNEVYFKSVTISEGSISDAPRNPDIFIHGYPLWLILHGWTDWQEKAHHINQIWLNYYLVIKTTFITPKMPAYIFLDKKFTNPEPETLTTNDKLHWHPRFQYQTESLNSIAVAGPGSAKINKSSSIQAKALYKFKFQWGGSPAPMHTIKDPCEQTKFPVPNNVLQAVQVQNPNTDPRTQLHDCDERRQQLTRRAVKRLKTICKMPETTLSEKTAFETPVHKDSSQETTTSEEEEETTLQQLIHIRNQQRKLKRKLHRLKLYQL